MNLVDRNLGIEVTVVPMNNDFNVVVVRGSQYAAPILREFIRERFQMISIPLYGGSTAGLSFAAFEIRFEGTKTLADREKEVETVCRDYLIRHIRAHGDAVI